MRRISDCSAISWQPTHQDLCLCFFRQPRHPAVHHPDLHRAEPESVHAADAHRHRRREGEEDQGEHEDGRTQGLCLLGGLKIKFRAVSGTFH